MKTRIYDDGGCVKLCNKPFYEMTLSELSSEIMVHRWHASKIHNARELTKRRKWWLEENKPIQDMDEINRMYENGEISKLRRAQLMGIRSNAIKYRMRVEDYLKYADNVVYEQRAIIAYLEELIAERQSQKASRKNLGKKGYDPRKNISVNNLPKPTKQNAQRTWRTRQAVKDMPKLKKSKARWKAYQKLDNNANKVMERLQAITTWDGSKIKLIAKDRGFFTDIALTAAVADALNVSLHGATTMLDNGKFTWGQILILGSLFEMTPKEFCDVFLSGYFTEVADGVYHAHVENINEFLDEPYKARVKKDEEGVQAEVQTVSD